MILNPKAILQIIAPLCLVIFFCILALLPFPWNEPAENILINLHFKIRGERDLGEDIVFVYLGAEDIKALGGWPITRDYYGYMTHALNTLGTEVIGFNLLFDSPDPRFPEYDHILADFFESAQNVCLPMAFYEFPEDSEGSLPTFFRGESPIYPIPELRKNSAGIGFSNLGRQVILHKTPVIATVGSDTLYSFGFELARIFLNLSDVIVTSSNSLILRNTADKEFTVRLDQKGQIRLNHFGDMNRVNSIGFVDLLQAFESSPDSLNLKGKILIVDVTAPGIPTLEATPLAAALPASLIHATVAENIIHQNYLNEIPKPAHLAIIALAVIFVWMLWQPQSFYINVGGSITVIMVIWVTSVLQFSQVNHLIPLFYPTLSVLGTIAVSLFIRTRGRRHEFVSIKSLLKEQIVTTEKKLAKAKTHLKELQTQLQNESEVSERMQALAEERKQVIIELEKQLDDLQSYVVPEKSRPNLQFSDIIYAQNSKMTEILELVLKVASDDIPVLIAGETGTGKEMIANAIHQNRRCRNLIKSEK